MAVKIKIGCIGPSDSIAVITETAMQYYPGVDLVTYEEEEIAHAWKRLALCHEQTSGILFSGIGVQESALTKGQVTLPYEHVPRGGYSLIRTLLEISRTMGNDVKLSIDVVEPDTIQSVIEEMEIHFPAIHTQPFDPAIAEKIYEKEHIRLHTRKRADVLVTGFGAVYERLKQAGYPVFRLYPSPFEIRENMNRLLARMSAKNLQSAGIAIQLIRLTSVRRDSIHQYDDLKKAGLFNLELLEYVQAMQASLFHMGNDYVIYANRGNVEDKENMTRFCDLMKWAEHKKIRMASGIGIGMTACEAEKSARKALSNALKENENAFFIIRQDKIRGPLGSDRELSYPFRISKEQDLKMAENIGITPGYLAKIRALTAKTGQTRFDAKDLADCLGVSERSARRILKKFTDGGYAFVSGTETAGRAGRPRQIVELKI